MAMKIIDPSTDPAWDDFVFSHRDSSVYHSSRWSEVLKRTYGYSPRYFVIEDHDHIIKAGMPVMLVKTVLGHKKLVCLPFTSHCNPLVDNNKDLNCLMNGVLKYKKKINVSSLEIRTKRSNHDYFPLPLTNDQYFITHVLHLNADLKEIRSLFHKSCIQRPLKKLEKGALKLYISNDISELKEFYRLQLHTRKKHGVPPQPYRYFFEMRDQLYSPGFMELLLALHKGNVIAGIIILKFKETVIYQSGASDERFLGLRPNHFLLWNAIKRAHADGYRYFDFGRSSVDDRGLVQFKDRWGTKRYELVYYFHPKVSGATSTRQNNSKYKFAVRIVRHLPIPLLRIIGKYSYRYLG